MLSAIKRLTSKSDSPGKPFNGRPPGLQAMSTCLQKKFARGVHYNMKIVIKGDRNVGKSCLFQRLQGLKFVEEYSPTDEIQVTSIQWNYKTTDDVVKVEVWDVVDRGRKKKRFDGLKMDNGQLEVPEDAVLDAEFLDVYKGTHGVIMMFDLTKTWTYEYVQKEVPKIPDHIPLIILANHCDMAHHRTVTHDLVNFYIEQIASNRTAEVRYTESSMRNGFGLKFLHKFFNLPFLQLQRESLLQQLERNEMETRITAEELNTFAESDEANYAKFQDKLALRRRQLADSQAGTSDDANTKSLLSIRPSASTNQLQQHPLQQQMAQQESFKRSQSGPICIGAGQPIPFKINSNIPKNSTFNTAIDYTLSDQQLAADLSKQLHMGGSTTISTSIMSVEEFCPEGGIDRNFLEDGHSQSMISHSGNILKTNANDFDTTDSDTDNGNNPLVSEMQDDFEFEDFAAIPLKQKTVLATNRKLFKGRSEDNEMSGGSFEPLSADSDNLRHTNADDLDSTTINSEISELTSDVIGGGGGGGAHVRSCPIVVTSSRTAAHNGYDKGAAGVEEARQIATEINEEPAHHAIVESSAYGGNLSLPGTPVHYDDSSGVTSPDILSPQQQQQRLKTTTTASSYTFHSNRGYYNKVHGAGSSGENEDCILVDGDDDDEDDDEEVDGVKCIVVGGNGRTISRRSDENDARRNRDKSKKKRKKREKVDLEYERKDKNTKDDVRRNSTKLRKKDRDMVKKNKEFNKEDDELEEFLNGSKSISPPPDAAYEAI